MKSITSIGKKMSVAQKLYIAGIGLMALFFVTAAFLQYYYLKSPKKDLEIQHFQSVLNSKILFADEQLQVFQKNYLNNRIPSRLENNNDNISFYVYKNDSLIFWSENEIGLPQLFPEFHANTAYLEIQHNCCVFRTLRSKNYKFVALIHIRNNYTEPNNYLSNDFNPDLGMDKQVQIVFGRPYDKYAVFTPEKQYLFSLSKENIKLYNHPLSLWSMLCWIIGFILLYLLVKNIHIPLRKSGDSPLLFFYTYAGLAALIYVGIATNEPWMMFQQDYFSPIQYGSGDILASLGHLTLISIFLISEIALFYTRVRLPKSEFVQRYSKLFFALFNIFSALYFVGIALLLRSLIINSTFDIRLYILENVSPMTFISLGLLLSWLTGFWLLRLKGLQYLDKRESFRFSTIINLIISLTVGVIAFFTLRQFIIIALWYFIICFAIDYIHYRKFPAFSLGNMTLLLALITLFEVHYSVTQYGHKLNNYVKTMAENINSGEVMDRNLFAEILFEELSEDLNDDDNLLEISNKKDSVGTEMQSYLMKNYFRGFWNNYEIKTYLFDEEHPSKNDLDRFMFYKNLFLQTERIKNTNFYFCTDEASRIDYLGVFDLHNELLFIEFYSKLRTNSYSYPEPLLKPQNANPTNEELSLARYVNNKISSQVGELVFPEKLNWITKSDSNFYFFDKWNYRHYVYKPNAHSTIIISKHKDSFYYVYAVYGAYLFAIYFFTMAIIYLFVRLLQHRGKHRYSFLSRLQLAFVSLLVVSFVSIFVISISYIISQYQKKQTSDIQNKTRYIKEYLSESLKPFDNFKQTNVVELNFLLQELSKTYETDIHIYDNKGVLVASSQPVIFGKGLLSYRMSPKPYFENQNEETLTEHIGKLNYLSAYTRVYNGNNQLLGYIAVPSFLSSGEIKKEIFNLSAVVINVYLVIIFLAILISFLVSKQLSRPMKALEQKLMSINLKGHNEKLEYQHNDEIGQLVNQYNLMVEKLAESADMLAQSERETAWKQMARQVTHEIKNPLTPMKLTIQQLQRMQSIDPEAFNEYFKKSSQMLIDQIEHLSNIATSFSDFAKMPETHQEQVDIYERLEQVVELFKNNNEEVAIQYEPQIGKAFVIADKEQLTQVFNNLLKNAIQAVPAHKKGLIQIITSVNNKRVCIEFRDNGTGIAPDIQDKLFKPNFTTKTSGMGLGLAIAKNIVTSNRGEIWFTTNADQGTSFFIEFPLV